MDNKIETMSNELAEINNIIAIAKADDGVRRIFLSEVVREFPDLQNVSKTVFFQDTVFEILNLQNMTVRKNKCFSKHYWKANSDRICKITSTNTLPVTDRSGKDRMSFADFEEHDTEDLQLASYLYKELKTIHLEGLDQDQIANLEDELQERLFKLADYLEEEAREKYMEKKYDNS